jgi:hypothetical protein
MTREERHDDGPPLGKPFDRLGLGRIERRKQSRDLVGGEAKVLLIEGKDVDRIEIVAVWDR